MLPQHGGVPNFKIRISGPFLILLGMVLFTGLMLTLASYAHEDPGDVAARNRTKLCFVATILLSIFVLIIATARLWHSHLWKSRRKGHSYRHRKHRHHHSSRHRSARRP